MSDKKVVVVGAGCAGLSATYTLRKHGIDAVAFEASDVAGGRCRSDTEDGYLISVGAQSTEPQWRTTCEYLDELGASSRCGRGRATCTASRNQRGHSVECIRWVSDHQAIPFSWAAHAIWRVFSLCGVACPKRKSSI